MASQPPPDSVILSQFSGLKNVVAPERLTANELAKAVNVDIDDSGQLRRRRGYTLKLAGNFRSMWSNDDKVYAVKDGVLGIIRPNYSFVSLATVGASPVCYVDVAGDTYFSSANLAGIITPAETVIPWGATSGQGTWISPVQTPDATLGAVSGRMLQDPPKATALTLYKGRIYLAQGQTLWATELYSYNYVDRTKNFMQFEAEITLLIPMSDGIYVGTVDGLYFITGTLGAFKLDLVSTSVAVPGSVVWAPADIIHPQNLSQPIAADAVAVFMTEEGIFAALDGGVCYNLTRGKYEFPSAVSAAALFRKDLGESTYLTVLDSGGTPTAAARMGDYISADIIRFAGPIVTVSVAGTSTANAVGVSTAATTGTATGTGTASGH